MKKLLLAFIAIIVLTAVSVFAWNESTRIGYNQFYEPDQPVKFSHKIHAGDNQMQCLYCHFGADKSRHAGVPPTELCLNCHKFVKTDSPEIKKVQEAFDSGNNIEWKKVNFFPDHAYFNHAQHVNVAGLQCQQCHGDVEKMEVYYQKEKFNMGFCLDCHREKGNAPPKDHFSAGGGDCSKCHQ